MNGPRRTLVAVTAAHAVAGLALLSASIPAAAQSDASPSAPGAVVCVGSELSTPRTPDPDRRFGWEGITVVYRSDVALAYRVGVPLADRPGVERALRSELGDHAEASCAWSNRGDRHVAIIGYTSSVRLSPTSDPDGSAYRRFAVGFGASAAAAEANATTGNDHFARYYDGGGYEVVARESWGVVEDGVAPGDTDRAAAAFEVFGVFRDCAFCPEMVVVPPGTFTMGSPESEEFRGAVEGPQHSVTIGAPFAVGAYEVTFAEWDACVQMGGCRYTPADRRWGRERRPVLYVSWEDAQAYVSWLSGLTGQPYRLLSEAEWEYVARAGTVTARYWGEGVSDLCRYANGAGGGSRARSFRGLRFSRGYGIETGAAPCNDEYGGTAPVGSFAPNAFGLYDVLGNVSEWTQDCWNDSHRGAPADGSARESGDCDRRVLRGGSWFIGAWFLRSANRSMNLPDSRDMYYGFRVARSLP
ncbi:MAG: formylglycine-generating enzyme family protein [Gemmatimonadetes bacterium]|nr:formylglycine-generating enzyme family protein [Candidatus Palauibacter australiensis]